MSVRGAPVSIEFDQFSDFHELWTVVWKISFLAYILRILLPTQIFDSLTIMNPNFYSLPCLTLMQPPTITNQAPDPDSLTVQFAILNSFLRVASTEHIWFTSES